MPVGSASIRTASRRQRWHRAGGIRARLDLGVHAAPRATLSGVMTRTPKPPPKRGPAMYVPSWSRQPSGLLVPTGDVEEAGAMSAAEVPLEVRPPPRPVALEHRPPAALDQFMTYIDEDLLKYQPSSLAR